MWQPNYNSPNPAFWCIFQPYPFTMVRWRFLYFSADNGPFLYHCLARSFSLSLSLTHTGKQTHTLSLAVARILMVINDITAKRGEERMRRVCFSVRTVGTPSLLRVASQALEQYWSCRLSPKHPPHTPDPHGPPPPPQWSPFLQQRSARSRLPSFCLVLQCTVRSCTCEERVLKTSLIKHSKSRTYALFYGVL